jgi:prepilin-type N-terminal cleavage/methylation domain-containing protein
MIKIKNTSPIKSELMKKLLTTPVLSSAALKIKFVLFAQYRNKHRQSEQGFTLLELLTAIVISSILMMIGAHAYAKFMQKYQRRALLQNISQQVQMAKNLAFREKINIVLRPHQNDWTNGWFIFKDDNHNQIQDANEKEIVQYFAKNQIVGQEVESPNTSNSSQPSNQKNIQTIIDTTGGCLAFDAQGLIKRCGNLQNLVLNGRIIVSHSYSVNQNSASAAESCANSSSLTILRHRPEMVCDSVNYSSEAAASTQNNFHGNCVCS